MVEEVDASVDTIYINRITLKSHAENEQPIHQVERPHPTDSSRNVSNVTFIQVGDEKTLDDVYDMIFHYG